MGKGGQAYRQAEGVGDRPQFIGLTVFTWGQGGTGGQAPGGKKECDEGARPGVIKDADKGNAQPSAWGMRGTHCRREGRWDRRQAPPILGLRSSLCTLGASGGGYPPTHTASWALPIRERVDLRRLLADGPREGCSFRPRNGRGARGHWSCGEQGGVPLREAGIWREA